MKTKRMIIASFIILFQAAGLLAQPMANSLLPQVDKRIELLSIAATLANIKGFGYSLNPAYAKAIDRHFTAYKHHPLIQHLRERKPELDKAGWEIPAVAVHLKQPPTLKPVMDFNDTAHVDDWESRALFNAKFVGLLQQFYRHAKVEEFFRARESYYQAVNRQYEKQGVKLNKQWVNDFFSVKTTEDYYPIVALGITEGAYMRVNFSNNYRQTFTIFETTSFDDKGMPATFNRQVFPRMMLHEYVHAFTNQLVDQHSRELRSYAEAMLKNPKVFKAVENTFYGNWQYLLYESLVRACSIKYFMANKGISEDVEKEIADQEKAGFLWMRGLVAELNNYEAKRNRYKNLSEYMPQINSFFKKTAEELKTND